MLLFTSHSVLLLVEDVPAASAANVSNFLETLLLWKTYIVCYFI
jgi:hypothetical protein